jgi:small subunit ribosomal protein S18
MAKKKQQMKFVVSPQITTGQQKKYCRFRRNNINYVDYRDVDFLMRFVNEQGKILPRRLTGNSLKWQRRVSTAIKRARQLALIPYVGDNLK